MAVSFRFQHATRAERDVAQPSTLIAEATGFMPLHALVGPTLAQLADVGVSTASFLPGISI